MKKRFTEEQIIGILNEQESGERTADVCRRHGISQATFYKYKSKYGGLEVSDARELSAAMVDRGRPNTLVSPSRAVLRNTLPGYG